MKTFLTLLLKHQEYTNVMYNTAKKMLKKTLASAMTFLKIFFYKN